MIKVDHQNKVPLYVQLKKILLEEIASGKIISDGGRLPSFREIAEKQGVSIITVSKAISELVDEGIVYARQGKGIYVTDIKKVKYLLSPSTITIGATFLDIYNLSNPYLSEIFRGLTESAHNLNLNLQVFATPSVEMSIRENPLFWQNIHEKRISGIILASRMPIKDVILLKEKKVPFVWIGNDLPGEDIYAVLLDKPLVSALIVEHLTLLGYRSFGLIVPAGDPIFVSSLRALSIKKGLSLKPEFIKEPAGEEKNVISRTVKEILSHHSKPDALIVVGEQAIINTFNTLLESGLSIPGDIGFIGSTGSFSQDFFQHNNVTVIEIPLKTMAQKAVEMLYSILINKEVPVKKPVVSGRFIIKGSCGFPVKDKQEIAISSIEELHQLHNNQKLRIRR